MSDNFAPEVRPMQTLMPASPRGSRQMSDTCGDLDRRILHILCRTLKVYTEAVAGMPAPPSLRANVLMGSDDAKDFV